MNELSCESCRAMRSRKKSASSSEEISRAASASRAKARVKVAGFMAEIVS